MKILELDLGNSFLKWRLRDGAWVGAVQRILITDLSLDWPLEWSGIQRVYLAAVAQQSLQSALIQRFQQMGVQVELAQTQAVCAGLKNAYAEPERLGVDRWLVMLAAWKAQPSACAILDAGSAITLDYIAADGQHLGGYILPGVSILRQSLLNNTARVMAGAETRAAVLSPGQTTDACVDNGRLHLLKGFVQSVQEEAAGFQIKRWILTGGDGELFKPWLPDAEYQADLVLDGLQWMFE